MMIDKKITELRGYEKRNGEFHLFFVFEDQTYIEVQPWEVVEDLNAQYKIKKQESGHLFKGGKR